MKRLATHFTCLLIVLTTAAAARAATVSYTFEVFDADADVSTHGTLISASNLGDTVNAVTVNGVVFAADSTGAAANPGDLMTVSASNFIDANGYTGGAIGSLSLADTNFLLDSVEFGGGGGNSLARLNGLTVGEEYIFQAIVVREPRNTAISFGYATPSGDLTEVYPVIGLSDNTPFVVTGTFVADETSQDLHIATGAGNGEVNAFQLREATGPKLIGDAGAGALWVLNVPTLGAYDNQSVGPSASANIYFDANGDLVFNAANGDTTGNTTASLATRQYIQDGQVLNFYFEDFNFNLESVSGITLSGVDIELSDGSLLDNVSLTEGTPFEFIDSDGKHWQVLLNVIDGGGGGDILTNVNSVPGGGGPDEQFTLTFIQVPAPAALPAGLAMLGLIATRRRRSN